MQPVHLHQRQRIYLLEDKVLVPKIPGYVQHDAPIGEARPVGQGRLREGAVIGKGLELGQALPAPEHALRRKRPDFNAPGTDGEPIGLLQGEIRQGKRLQFPAEGPVGRIDLHIGPVGTEPVGLSGDAEAYGTRYQLSGVRRRGGPERKGKAGNKEGPIQKKRLAFHGFIRNYAYKDKFSLFGNGENLPRKVEKMAYRPPTASWLSFLPKKY